MKNSPTNSRSYRQHEHDGTDDPLDFLRRNREAVSKLAQQDRADDLDAAARVLLALADGERPDPADLDRCGLQLAQPDDEWQRIAYAPALGRPAPADVRRLGRHVERALTDANPGGGP